MNFENFQWSMKTSWIGFESFFNVFPNYNYSKNSQIPKSLKISIDKPQHSTHKIKRSTWHHKMKKFELKLNTIYERVAIEIKYS